MHSHVGGAGGLSKNSPKVQFTQGGPNLLAQQNKLSVKDALSYLDQVRLQFEKKPKVYNQFLDIMKDFKSSTIDTPGVINRVSELFEGHTDLIVGFNTFLPPGYKIEQHEHDMPGQIRVTVSEKAQAEAAAAAHQRALASGQPPPAGISMGMASQQMFNYKPGSGPTTIVMGGGVNAQLMPQQQPHGGGVGQPQAGMVQMNRGGGPPQHQVPGGVPGGPQQRPPMGGPPPQVQGAPGGGSIPPQPAHKVEFNHAINYVNKIKKRFSNDEEVYKKFLDILHSYQREHRPIEEVYNEVAELFKNERDLLDEFSQFLPEASEHQAQKQAMEQQAAQQRALEASKKHGICCLDSNYTKPGIRMLRLYHGHFVVLLA